MPPFSTPLYQHLPFHFLGYGCYAITGKHRACSVALLLSLQFSGFLWEDMLLKALVLPTTVVQFHLNYWLCAD